MTRQDSIIWRYSLPISALLIIIGIIGAYVLHGPKSIGTSMVAIVLGFLFPLTVNFFGITSSSQIEHQRRQLPDEPTLELPSDLEDDPNLTTEKDDKSSFIEGMEQYFMMWSIMTFILIFILPVVL